MNKIEDAPSDIFGWIETRAYETLSEAEQALVLGYMDRKEYESMHEAACLAKAFFNEERLRRSGIRENLMERFDRHYARPVPLFRNTPAMLWKAAAIFLGVGLPVAVYLLFRSNREMLTQQAGNRVDTVFLERVAAQPVKEYDTVYILKEASRKKPAPFVAPPLNPAPVDELDVKIPAGAIHIRNIREAGAAPNQPKRNAIKDDSLISRFNFVRL